MRRIQQVEFIIRAPAPLVRWKHPIRRLVRPNFHPRPYHEGLERLRAAMKKEQEQSLAA